MKKCSMCKVKKKEFCFSKSSKEKDGLQSWCKECFSTHRKTAYKEKMEKSGRKYNPHGTGLSTKEIKMAVIDYYGNVCECCGESKIEFLCIDHINGGGNKERRGKNMRGSAFYRYLIRNDFPSGYRVLCHNCNFSLGIYGYCPHQK